jgi:hypothetical protein
MDGPGRHGRNGSLRVAALAGALLAAALATRSLAQETAPPPPPTATPPSAPPAARRPAPLPDLPAGATTFADRTGSFGGFQFSDLARVDVAPVGRDLVFQVEMQKDLADGMYTKVEVDFDFDGLTAEPELRLRASAGSRFCPSSFVPAPGLDAPLDLLRASWASPFDERHGATARIGMTNWDELQPPVVGGRRLRFAAPSELVKSHGKGSTSQPTFRVRVDTTCSEHPVAFDYDAIDAGRPIVVDGRPEEWSGGPYAEDPAGELHESVAHLDLRAVWCEHGPDAVYLRIDLDRTGFGTIRRGDGDVGVDDRIVVRLEPRGDAYMDAVEVEIPATSVRGSGAGGSSWVCGTKTVEVAIPRNPKQTRFRVVVWADAMRSDVLQGGFLPVPPEWFR